MSNNKLSTIAIHGMVLPMLGLGVIALVMGVTFVFFERDFKQREERYSDYLRAVGTIQALTQNAYTNAQMIGWLHGVLGVDQFIATSDSFRRVENIANPEFIRRTSFSKTHPTVTADDGHPAYQALSASWFGRFADLQAALLDTELSRPNMLLLDMEIARDRTTDGRVSIKLDYAAFTTEHQ